MALSTCRDLTNSMLNKILIFEIIVVQNFAQNFLASFHK